MGYISIIMISSIIEVDDDAIRVFGRKDVLADAITGRGGPAGNVSGFVRKWRAMQNEDENWVVLFSM